MNNEKQTILQITRSKQISTSKGLYHTVVLMMTIYPGPLENPPQPSTRATAAAPIVCGAGDSGVDVTVAAEARALSSQHTVAAPEHE